MNSPPTHTLSSAGSNTICRTGHGDRSSFCEFLKVSLGTINDCQEPIDSTWLPLHPSGEGEKKIPGCHQSWQCCLLHLGWQGTSTPDGAGAAKEQQWAGRGPGSIGKAAPFLSERAKCSKRQLTLFFFFFL